MIQGIFNASIKAAGNCRAEKQRAAELMKTVVKPNLVGLAKYDLVAVPMPERELLSYLDKIWEKWADKIRNGLTIFDDTIDGSLKEISSQRRFKKASIAEFSSKLAFCNGIFQGRYFIWIHFPDIFMTVDFLEFMAFGCRKSDVVPIFGQELSTMIEQFSEYASQLGFDEERQFNMEIAALYERQPH